MCRRDMPESLGRCPIGLNTFDAADHTVPFGGFKLSGFGRDCGRAGYQQKKQRARQAHADIHGFAFLVLVGRHRLAADEGFLAAFQDRQHLGVQRKP